MTAAATPSGGPRRFQVALSFPGEHRTRVENIAEALAARLGGDKKKILYDRFHSAEFARPKLGLGYLPDLYHNESELIVAFLCEDYPKKQWTGLEWRAIFDLISKRQDERIMLLCVDDIDIEQIPGLYSTDGCIPIAKIPDAQVTEYILERLAQVQANQVVNHVQDRLQVKPTPAAHRTQIRTLPTVDPFLIGRDAELKFLNDAFANPQTNTVQIIAPGGTGKTALMTKFYKEHLSDATIFGWSFYSQGTNEKSQTSSDPFFAAALPFFHLGAGPNAPPTAGPFAQADALIDHLRTEKVLLILDGVEPLQNKDGDLQDSALKALIQELAASNAGMVLITTRVRLSDLPDDQPRALSLDLDNLTPEDGARYLEHLKVKGEPDELSQASEAYGNHALALTLLGTYLTTFCDSDIRRRTDIKELQIEDTKPGRHARKVMASYALMYEGQPELDILKALGYFDRPAEPAALKLVLPDGLAMGQRKYQAALKNLRDARLVLTDDPTHDLDCHPLVREHFSAHARQEGHARLYEHYKKQAPQQPDTLDEMRPLFYAVYHGCQAGKHQDALEGVYDARILRGNQAYLATDLGAFGADLTLLANFFVIPWSRPAAALFAADQTWVTAQAGFSLRALGRLANAMEPMRASAEARVKTKDWKNAAAGYTNLSQLQLASGNIAEAIAAARQSVEFADRSGGWQAKEFTRTDLADALHQSGDLSSALRLFEEAERLQVERQPEYPILYSFSGHQYCELLLSKGQAAEVLRRASVTLEWASVAGAGLLSLGLDHLSLGHAHPLGSPKAKHHLDEAAELLRRAGNLDYLPLALLARATPRDLDEAFRIATRSGMRLHLTDCHLISARQALATGDPSKARDHFAQAETLVNQTGYHRRDPELAALRTQLTL